MDDNEWIDPNLRRPGKEVTIEVQINGGQFAGKWTQEAEYRDGHFFMPPDIILDKDVYGWRYITER